MHPAHLKARQAAAMAGTAAGLAAVDARLAAIEAKLDEALTLLRAPAPNDPAPPEALGVPKPPVDPPKPRGK